MNFTGNPIAVQLYTLRDECEKDFPGTLAKVAEAGFGAVEFAGLHNHTAEEIRKILDEKKLKAAGCHLGLGEFQKNFDTVKRDYVDTLKCEYVTVPSGPREFNDGGKTWRKFCQDMRDMKKKCEAAGIKLAYHNHHFEFENQVDGKPAYDIMFHEKPEESPTAEVDLCWVAAGKHDPVNELRRLKGRVKLVHVKDLDPGMPPKDTEVGSGVLQWPAIYKAAEEAGVKWLIVERDHPNPPAIDSIKQSLAFLKAHGLEK
jgi:sugar phosphate isomerase/epimerase